MNHSLTITLSPRILTELERYVQADLAYHQLPDDAAGEVFKAADQLRNNASYDVTLILAALLSDAKVGGSLGKALQERNELRAKRFAAEISPQAVNNA